MANKRKFGDRKDGRYLRSLDPYNKFAPYIMKTKNDANVFFSDSAEITEVDRYLRKKRAEGMPGLGMLHVFIASYIRVVSQKPALNRFVAGQRIYARNSIELVMTIKREMRSDAPETSIKVVFDPKDTINDVYRKINAEVESIKDQAQTSTDNVAGALIKFPRVVLKFAIFVLNIMDYFGQIPNSLIQASPFHGSIIITDLGSIGLPPVFHHLYNFGNMPIFVAIGEKRRTHEIQADGSVVEKKYLDYTIVLDERICDGFNFGQALKFLKSYIKNPEVLDVPPETVVEDVS